jgi:hypothetical protein
MTIGIVLLLTLVLFVPSGVFAQDPAAELGFRLDTEIAEGSGDDEFCPGAVLIQNDDGDFENGYAWTFAGVVPPDYGSWAECYDSDFVCGIQFLFTRNPNDPTGQTMDVYVWESVADGSPPPGPDPGNVLCILPGISPWPIAEWPEISTHNIQVCCDTGGSHFVGFWGNWPGSVTGWFIAGDENGPEIGCPRTKIAPGIGYPTGWHHVTDVQVFDRCKNLGIREFAGVGDCEPTPATEATWGQIKALY